MSIKFRKLNTYILILLICLSTAQCKVCTSASKQLKKSQKENEKQRKKNQGKKKHKVEKNQKSKKKRQQDEEEKEKEQEALARREKFKEQYGYEARKQNREDQRKKQQQSKISEVAKPSISAQEKKDQLAKLVEGQEVLQKKAATVLKQLLEDEPDSPAQEIFQNMPAYFEDAVEKAINDPTQIGVIIDGLEDIRDSLTTLAKLLEDEKVVYIGMFHRKVKDLSLSYDVNLEFTRGVDLEFEGQHNQPIVVDKLSEREKFFYDRIVAKYPSAKNSAMIFMHKARTEDRTRLLKNTNAQLDILYNIQKQHELQEK